MKRTTSRSEARQALLKPQAAAAEERKRLEIANVGDLTTFVVESAKFDDVDEWERDRLKRLRADAAVRLRGESISSIAPQTGVSTVVVRGFLQAAASDASAGALDGEVGSAESTAAASATSGESTLGGGVRTGSVPKAS
jgi:hypothetical protein